MRSLAERLSVSPGDAPSRPAGPPLGALATWALECGALLSDADVAEVYRVLRAGGRPAVAVALNVAHRAPPRLRARLVVEAWAERVAVEAFQVNGSSL